MLKEYLLNFGFTEKDYENIISTPRLYSLRNDSLYKHILEMNNYFLSFGFKKEEIIKMIRKRSSIYSQSPSSLTKKFNFLLNYGYKKEELIKHKITSPIASLSLESIKNKLIFFNSFGINNRQVVKLLVSCPNVLTLSIESMHSKIEDLKSLGYKENEIISILLIYPAILTYNIETIKNKIKDIMSLGYTLEEALHITKTLPALFGLSFETIKEKIDFYNSIGLENIPVDNPKCLMQSTSLSKARYEFLKERNIEITKKNYRIIFKDNKSFQKTFGVSNEQVLSNYSESISLKLGKEQKC